MGDLVMRLETVAAKLDRKVRASLLSDYEIEIADLRELLIEVVIHIKRLEIATGYYDKRRLDLCGND